MLPACGDDKDNAKSTGSDLPPFERDQLAALFGPQLEDFGLRFTRGALQDIDNRYVPSPKGRHLALYAEPTGARTGTQYVQDLMPTTRLFLPEVFERWKGLESFDFCQEPPPGVDDRAEPPPVTQVRVTRVKSQSIDWNTITYEQLAERARQEKPDLFVFVNAQFVQPGG